MEKPELIAKENIPLIWSYIGPRLDSVIRKLEFTEFTLADFLELLLEGQAQLWVADNGDMIAVTRIIVYPDFKRLYVDFIEGTNWENYTHYMEYIEDWAVQLGATQAETELRPGLERIARQNGWKRRRVHMFKHLKKGIH
jgi:hypothetical protein